MTHWRRGNLSGDENGSVLGWTAWGGCVKLEFGWVFKNRLDKQLSGVVWLMLPPGKGME